MTLKGGTSQACAACKYQRRKCASECPLGPYFPADRPKMFQSVHRLFGVRNILRILKDMDVRYHAHAMQSIIYHATMRDVYPVHGCLAIIHQLYKQIERAEQELLVVSSQLALYQNHQQQDQSCERNDVLQLEMGQPDNNGNNYMDFNFKDNNALPVNGLWNQHAAYETVCNNNMNNDDHNALEIQSQMQYIVSQPLDVIQQETAQKYDDELHPFFDTIDGRHTYKSNASYDSSPIEHFTEDERKDAAACLRLTSV